MAKITFWKWQHTDQFGLPCVTRSRLVSSPERERLEDEKSDAWYLESRGQKQIPASDYARGTQK